MTVNQIYGIVESVNAQMHGSAAVAVTDLSGLISMGQSVISSDAEKDTFLNVLADRIGKTVLRTLDVVAEFPFLLRNDFEFGAILQKIDIEPLPAQANTSETIGANGYTPNQFAINKPTVTQTFFTDADTWSYKVTIPDSLLKRAFTSAEAMGAFITGIMDALEKSMTEGLNAMAHMAVANFIGEKIHAENGVVNLLTEYKTKTHDTTLTADTAMFDEKFLKFASMVIKNYIGYMSTPKTIFNTVGKKRATTRDNMHVMLLNDFASAVDTFSTASTFHNFMVELPMYQPVEHWQGACETAGGAVNANNEINITTSSGHDVAATGIVGVLADREAISIGLTDKYTATDRNNSDRYTNYTSGSTIQYINDLSENGVVFIVADSE